MTSLAPPPTNAFLAKDMTFNGKQKGQTANLTEQLQTPPKKDSSSEQMSLDGKEDPRATNLTEQLQTPPKTDSSSEKMSLDRKEEPPLTNFYNQHDVSTDEDIREPPVTTAFVNDEPPPPPQTAHLANEHVTSPVVDDSQGDIITSSQGTVAAISQDDESTAVPDSMLPLREQIIRNLQRMITASIQSKFLLKDTDGVPGSTARIIKNAIPEDLFQLANVFNSDANLLAFAEKTAELDKMYRSEFPHESFFHNKKTSEPHETTRESVLRAVYPIFVYKIIDISLVQILYGKFIKVRLDYEREHARELNKEHFIFYVNGPDQPPVLQENEKLLVDTVFEVQQTHSPNDTFNEQKKRKIPYSTPPQEIKRSRRLGGGQKNKKAPQGGQKTKKAPPAVQSSPATANSPETATVPTTDTIANAPTTDTTATATETKSPTTIEVQQTEEMKKLMKVIQDFGNKQGLSEKELTEEMQKLIDAITDFGKEHGLSGTNLLARIPNILDVAKELPKIFNKTAKQNDLIRKINDILNIDMNEFNDLISSLQKAKSENLSFKQYLGHISKQKQPSSWLPFIKWIAGFLGGVLWGVLSSPGIYMTIFQLYMDYYHINYCDANGLHHLDFCTNVDSLYSHSQKLLPRSVTTSIASISSIIFSLFANKKGGRYNFKIYEESDEESDSESDDDESDDEALCESADSCANVKIKDKHGISMRKLEKVLRRIKFPPKIERMARELKKLRRNSKNYKQKQLSLLAMIINYIGPAAKWGITAVFAALIYCIKTESVGDNAASNVQANKFVCMKAAEHVNTIVAAIANTEKYITLEPIVIENDNFMFKGTLPNVYNTFTAFKLINTHNNRKIDLFTKKDDNGIQISFRHFVYVLDGLHKEKLDEIIISLNSLKLELNDYPTLTLKFAKEKFVTNCNLNETTPNDKIITALKILYFTDDALKQYLLTVTEDKRNHIRTNYDKWNKQ